MTEVLDINSLLPLNEAGFSGGRDNLHAFCQSVFSEGKPRYLRSSQGALVVFHHADLIAFGTSAQIGNVPPAVLYPGKLDAPADAPPVPGKRIAEVIATQVFTTNPPIHGPTRRILLNWLGPKQTAAMEGLVREVVEDIVGKLESGSEIDFVPEISEALTVGFWSRLLALTPDETAHITQATRDMTRLFTLNRNDDDLRVLDQAFDDYAKILDSAAERALQRGDPALLEIQRQLKELNFEEDIHTVGIYPRTVGEVLSGNLIDGFHTAALASANTCYALSRHPEILDEVRGSPQLLARAIAESLRLEPPVILLKRYALDDFEHDGTLIPRGTQIVMMWGAGNLDPKAFPDPEKFDLSRNQQGITTFGNGIHICPGRYVGVMLTRVLLEGFEARNLRFGPGKTEARWIPSHIMSQLSALPLKVECRQAGATA